MKILVNDGMSASGAKALKEAGFTLYEDKVAQDDLISFMNKEQIDAILVRSATKVGKDIIDNVESLKLIGRGGVGLDNIDVDHARKKGIYVINTPAASSTSVAELVFAHMFGMARGLHDSNRNMPLEGDSRFKDLKKSYAGAVELRGKTLAVVGLGRIGKEVAKIGLGIGMHVIGVDSSDTDGIKTIPFQFFNDEVFNYKIEVKPMIEAIEEADFITFHIPAQKDYVISKKELESMKTGVFIVNAARGGVIDEVALVEALDSGKVAAAALDVFEKEPTPEIQLLMHPKLSLSPHVGGSTVEAQDRIGVELADQICDLLKVEA
ncbi:D-2-hydroxyacid dehydrogenase [Weeksellaceae bacterium KMM 9713]|uniref:D-2-hydroxyacid dehydrogenase n=1 Tax=Profundicola chukchiensis TaxID=2961959 RepID=A0A9X4RX31_9FLAO|nr:D-2-hydroxyacid dehydrogenase [Profundicola chukchiensis]MDG4946497.1 D-2-hydroxyacid dehydrogenase [Profundicola chukchiensis]MDG4950697.1 D-2-hydroxyacid dehydrogenase [Profundicola chukchiensis]